MTPVFTQYLSTYLLIYIPPRLYCSRVCVCECTQPQRCAHPLGYFIFCVCVWDSHLRLFVLMKWNAEKMEHAVKLICFLNYLPCAKPLFASMFRALHGEALFWILLAWFHVVLFVLCGFYVWNIQGPGKSVTAGGLLRKSVFIKTSLYTVPSFMSVLLVWMTRITHIRSLKQ